ncbi:MAG: hypothetical protein OER12_07365 [Acidimicrobiia bacterium]|nr:hypothetical protein [Acidimicrobiia bacterium]
MDNYNPDLIFDLAAGILPEDEARAAEAALTAEGRAELAAQRAVLAAIAAEPMVGMNDIERAQLHRSVADGIAATTRELSPVEIAQPRASTRQTRSVRWMRWASAATAAAMFVGVVAVGSQLSIGGDSDTSDTTIATAGGALSSATTVAATTTTAEAARAEAGADSFESADGALLEPPEVRSANVEEDLRDLAVTMINTQRFDSLATLACYDEAMQELTIVDWEPVTFISEDGSEVEAIGFSYRTTATADPTAIQLYEVATCLPIVTE